MSKSPFEDTEWLQPNHSDLSQLSAKYFGERSAPVHVDFGALSHCGLLRTNNEDHYCVVKRSRSRDVLLTNMPAEAFPPSQDDAYAMAVADGLGGAAFGELASMLALRTGWELSEKAFKWNFHLSENELVELEQGMKVYMELIHRRIQEEARSNGAFQGMGTTLTGILTMGKDAMIVHVGDSRAYLFREGTLRRLTKDQTLAESMVAIGLIASVDDAAKRFRNTLVSCLGGNLHELEVETNHIVLQDGDLLMLCTDGLTDMVSESGIAAILAHPATAQTHCQELIDAALAGGGRDNVTVAMGQYSIVKSA